MIIDLTKIKDPNNPTRLFMDLYALNAVNGIDYSEFVNCFTRRDLKRFQAMYGKRLADCDATDENDLKKIGDYIESQGWREKIKDPYWIFAHKKGKD
jgi:hypothetical protein